MNHKEIIAYLVDVQGCERVLVRRTEPVFRGQVCGPGTSEATSALKRFRLR